MEVLSAWIKGCVENVLKGEENLMPVEGSIYRDDRLSEDRMRKVNSGS